MAPYRLSRLAETDLKGIADYTVDTCGKAQALRYIAGLRECCERIAAAPDSGRKCNHIRPGYLRIEQGRHVILYRQDTEGIFVGRILHRNMLVGKHVIEEPPVSEL